MQFRTHRLPAGRSAADPAWWGRGSCSKASAGSSSRAPAPGLGRILVEDLAAGSAAEGRGAPRSAFPEGVAVAGGGRVILAGDHGPVRGGGAGVLRAGTGLGEDCGGGRSGGFSGGATWRTAIVLPERSLRG